MMDSIVVLAATAMAGTITLDRAPLHVAAMPLPRTRRGRPGFLVGDADRTDDPDPRELVGGLAGHAFE